ncbi:MAG: trigger factor [Actinomycetota bacterium]|nr:trigger factor [Actinomycetota bacterium]
MRTSVEELPQNRVRLEVEVSEADVRHALEHAASDLAKTARLPGFRKGKAPLPLVVARVGREALWQEAIRSHLEGWFWNAAETSGIQPVGSPELELGEAPSDGGPFRFTAIVDVVPKPEVVDWTKLEVPAREPEVPAELVERELEALRASIAELIPAGDRPARTGDTVVLDLMGEQVGTQRDYVVEVGSGRLVEEIDALLPGMSAGETRTVTVSLDDGETTELEVTLKDVKEKVLPALDDQLARAATEFDTIDELRADVERRLREQIADELEGEFREAAVDALVAASRVEVPLALVDRRAAELWAGMTRSLERRGISTDTYMTMTGQSQEEIVGRLRADGEQAVKRELVLDAVADELGIEVGDDEVEAFVREQAEAVGDDPDETLRAVGEHGGLERLRGDLRLRRALDAIVKGVQRIPADVAAAREKLWTPEKEKRQSGMNIWTPGSEEARTR